MSVTIHDIKISDRYILPVMLILLKDKDIISVPTQIGCAINCDFCISKSSKFIRNLTSDELVNLSRSVLSEKQTIISFTGEGEPLLNIDHISNAILELENIENVSSFRICMSGHKSENLKFIPNISKPLDLQISLHSPFDSVRGELIQNTKPISYILEHVDINKDKFREISINYVLMKGINDRDEDLYELAKIIPKNYIIKLNPLLDESKYMMSSRRDYFYENLIDYGYNVKLFNKVGSDIKNKIYNNLTYKSC